MVGASGFQSIDMGFVSLNQITPKDFKNGNHSFPAWHSAQKSVENKLASLLVVSSSKALHGMPPSLCGRLMVGQAAYLSWWPSPTKDAQTKHELLRINESYESHCMTNCFR